MGGWCSTPHNRAGGQGTPPIQLLTNIPQMLVQVQQQGPPAPAAAGGEVAWLVPPQVEPPAPLPHHDEQAQPAPQVLNLPAADAQPLQSTEPRDPEAHMPYDHQVLWPHQLELPACLQTGTRPDPLPQPCDAAAAGSVVGPIAAGMQLAVQMQQAGDRTAAAPGTQPLPNFDGSGAPNPFSAQLCLLLEYGGDALNREALGTYLAYSEASLPYRDRHARLQGGAGEGTDSSMLIPPSQMMLMHVFKTVPHAACHGD